MGKDYSLTMDFPLGHHLRDLPGPVLLTGHTGFKGTWMTYLLEYMKIPVIGYSLEAEKDSLFDRANRTGRIPEIFADIRDYEALEHFIDSQKPSTVIHMAAQPLVLKSYEKPRETFDVNVMGTVNILDIAFKKDFVKSIIIVTTDKVYKNNNSRNKFVESDPLEGKDPYSASKVGTEAVVVAWQQIAKVFKGPKIASVRAGNVIGGGDYAKDRIIPDLIRGIIEGKEIEIRNPESTRPWQHVLDPLTGYLMLLEKLVQGLEIQSLNFGPGETGSTVRELIVGAEKMIDTSNTKIIFRENNQTKKILESLNLNLNSDSAEKILGWVNSCEQMNALRLTLEWWDSVLTKRKDASEVTLNQVRNFIDNLKPISSIANQEKHREGRLN
jgi:CDP-glucose 4,6-dehydratase